MRKNVNSTAKNTWEAAKNLVISNEVLDIFYVGDIEALDIRYEYDR